MRAPMPLPLCVHLACRAPPRGTCLHILRALRSDRWDHETLAVVRAAAAATSQPAAVRGQTCYHELPDAGHWVRVACAVRGAACATAGGRIGTEGLLTSRSCLQSCQCMCCLSPATA